MSRNGAISEDKKTLFNFRLLLSGIGLFFLTMTIGGCAEEHKSTIGNVDPEVFPTMLTTDVSTLVSDSGYTRYHLTTDLWLVFDAAREPKWRFPTGLFMERYNDNMEVTSTFQSDSAIYLTNKRLWRFDGDVRMRNTDGDRFATEQLFWDQAEQKVYSDSFIHIERVDRILEGYGFISNEQMTEYTILNVSGIFPTPQRKERPDSTEIMTDSSSVKNAHPPIDKPSTANSRNNPATPTAAAVPVVNKTPKSPAPVSRPSAPMPVKRGSDEPMKAN